MKQHRTWSAIPKQRLKTVDWNPVATANGEVSYRKTAALKRFIRLQSKGLTCKRDRPDRLQELEMIDEFVLARAGA